MMQTITEDTPYLLRIVGSEIRVEQPAEFDKSFFHEEYKSILHAVGNVVESTEAYYKQKIKHPSYPDIRIHNIVPIIGLRGAGKSSVLHTVAGILENNAADLPETFAAEKSLLLGKEFVVMDSIDGSLLEPYEDVFLTILAQMNRMLPKNDDFSQEQGSQRHLLREVRKQIEEFYGNARQMEEDSTDYRREEISDLNALNRLSDSLSLRQDFQKLLNLFLGCCAIKGKTGDSYRSVFFSKQDEWNTRYLVIPIDDLDLNLNQGYCGLEKLHRYLMLPNVIVLLAFDHDQMKRLCEREFYRMIPKYDSRMNAAAPVIEKLARQYLEKVMPLNLRTYLPQFAIRKDVKATLDKDGEGNDKKSNGKELSNYLPRHLVFKLMYEKLGMRMDTDGEKYHFLERKSLRGFINFITLLNGLVEPLADGSAGVLDEDILRHNHRILRQEITQGIAALPGNIEISTSRDWLTSPKQLFESVVETEKPIPRAFRKFLSIILSEGRRCAEEDTLHHLAKSAEFYGFSYGELLHMMYHYGRIDDDKKALVRSLIAYYALIMNRSYLRLWSQQSPKRQTWDALYAPYRKEFLELMNGSVSGSWSNSMVPQVQIYNLYYGTGLRRVLDMRKAFAINSETFEKYFIKQTLKDEEIIRCYLYSVLIVGMLFDRQNYKTSETFTFLPAKISEESDNMRNLLAQNSPFTKFSNYHPISGRGTFSFLNFVSSAFQYPEYIEKLLTYAADYAKENKALLHLADGSTADNAIDAVAEEIKKEFEEWDRNYRSFAIPVYDLDVCYNLVKRLLQDRYGKSDYIGSAGQLFDNYLDIYRAIATRLSSNDEVYTKKCNVTLGIDKLRPSYADAYCNCPLVKWLGIQADGSCNKGKSEVVSHTIDLTSLLLERVFMNMTESISVSHRDATRYYRTAGYDD